MIHLLNQVFKTDAMIFLCFLLLFGTGTQAQSDPLDRYIQQALLHHGLIKEQSALIEEKKVGYALAKKLFSPEINLGTSYTLALGGRNIAFPIGDLLNPVNDALNDLTNSSKFPTLENQTIQFLPNNFYDIRTRITQPIINPEIKIGQTIKREQIALQEMQRDIIERDVIRDVKKAYYQYLLTLQAIDILAQSQLILDESDRVTQSLIRNGVALPSTALRIQAERAKINTQLYAAQHQRTDAASYLNFMIGRPAADSIEVQRTTALPDLTTYRTEIKNEELMTLDKSMEIQHHLIDLEKKYNAPRLGAQLDLGSQNFDFKWGGYVLGGLQLDVPIWNNKKNLIRQQEIKAGINAVIEKRNWASQSFHFQLDQAQRQVKTAIDQYHSYTPILDMSRRYFTEIFKKFKEGQANPTELIDAQAQITLALLQQNIALYQSWIHAVDFERFTLDNKN